jgi:hypothetical protein
MNITEGMNLKWEQKMFYATNWKDGGGSDYSLF